MKALFLLLAFGCCAGCDDVPHTWSESEIRALVEDTADDGSYELAAAVSSRVDELETRVEDLERENGHLEAELSSLRSEVSLIPTY